MSDDPESWLSWLPQAKSERHIVSTSSAMIIFFIVFTPFLFNGLDYNTGGIVSQRYNKTVTGKEMDNRSLYVI